MTGLFKRILTKTHLWGITIINVVYALLAMQQFLLIRILNLNDVPTKTKNKTNQEEVQSSNNIVACKYKIINSDYCTKYNRKLLVPVWGSFSDPWHIDKYK